MPADRSFVFAFCGRDLLVERDEGRARVPDAERWASLALPRVRENDLAVAGAAGIVVELGEDAEAPDGFSVEGLRGLFARLDDWSYRLALRAVQIVAWDRDHQFCSRCASPVARVAGVLVAFSCKQHGRVLMDWPSGALSPFCNTDAD